MAKELLEIAKKAREMFADESTFTVDELAITRKGKVHRCVLGTILSAIGVDDFMLLNADIWSVKENITPEQQMAFFGIIDGLGFEDSCDFARINNEFGYKDTLNSFDARLNLWERRLSALN